MDLELCSLWARSVFGKWTDGLLQGSCFIGFAKIDRDQGYSWVNQPNDYYSHVALLK